MTPENKDAIGEPATDLGQGNSKGTSTLSPEDLKKRLAVYSLLADVMLRATRVLTIVFMVIAFGFVGVRGGFEDVLDKILRTQPESTELQAIESTMHEFSTRLTGFENEQKALLTRLDELAAELEILSTPSEDTKLLATVNLIKERIEELYNLAGVSDPNAVEQLRSQLLAVATRIESLESVILEDPSKAIRLVLLKEDVHELKEADIANLAALRKEIDRVYDMNKWLLGAMAMGLISLAIDNSRKDRKSRVEQQGPPKHGAEPTGS